MNNLILRRILSVILLFALTAAQLPLAHAVDEGLTISLNADGLEEGAYDALIDDEISFSYSNKSYTIGQTYRISVTFGTEISFLNATGSSMIASRHFYLDGSAKKTGWPNNKTKTLDDLSGAVATEEMLKQAGFAEESFESGCKSYYFFAFYYKEIQYGVLLQVKADSEGITEEDKALLQQLVASVTGDNEANWHQTNDRYNGNDADTITDQKSGFWAELTAQNGPLAQAQAVLDNPGSIQELSDAASALQAAINKLIPITQVNATRLYEAVQAYQKLKESDYTAASWVEGELLYGKMVTLLDSLFDEDGNATDANTAGRQAEADALVDQTYNDGIANKYWDSNPLVNKAYYDSYYTVYETRRQEAQNLLNAYDPARLTGSDYTTETWSAYTEAYDTLKKNMDHTLAGGTWADYQMVSMFETHLERLISARLQLTSSGDVTCSFTYVNNLLARYPDFREEGTVIYENPSMSLEAGSTTVSAALEQARITYCEKHDSTFPAGATNDSDTNALLAIYLNGEWVASSYVKDLAETGIQIPNNAEVLVVRYALPAEQGEASTGETTSEWSTYPADSTADYSDSFALIDIEGPEEEVAVGDKVTITGSVTGASYSHLGEDFGGEGLTLFVSEPNETETLSVPAKQTTAVTGADGSLEYVFTKPGWYTVALFDMTEDVLTSTDIFQETTIGTYPSLYVGGFMTLYVKEAETGADLVEQYRAEKGAEAEAFFQQYHDYDFAAGYYEETFAPLYETLKANLAAATDFAGLMDQYDEDYSALRAAAANALDHTVTLADLRADLALIPGDLSAMDETYKTLVKDIQTAYAALNDYQKSLLTPNETSKLEQIAVLDTDSLTKLANVTVTFYKPEEKEYPFATIQGTFSGTGGAALYNWPNWNWTSHRKPNGTIPDPNWSDTRQYAESMAAKAGDYVYVRLYLNTTEQQYWPLWSVDNGATWELFETATYGGVEGYYLATWQVPENAAEGSTYHIDLKMISRTEYEEFLRAGDTEGLEQSKKTAIAALKAEYQQYRADSSLPAATLVKIEEVMTAGIEAVNAAMTNTEVAEARKAALSAMSLAAGNTEEVSGADYDSGETVGRVHVTIENTTYSEGAFYGPGSIADGWYALGENDSMMTMVLKILDSQGYEWTGTGGTTASGYDITYLSSVSKDGQTLAEKQGGTAAGWMGTLNDWFTNLGFHAFTYANGGLEDGDEIHIMFSLNAGEDLGGTWNNNDTRLAALEITSGTLAPAFSRDITDYLLVVPDGRTALQVEPEAANKNFQARIFLNSYDRDNARYKSGETIPVTSGDVLYVGVGESGWPTMNTGNRGTKYTIQVETLAEAIASLPQDGEVTQSNYEVYGQITTILEGMVASDGYQGDTGKLKSLRDRVTFFKDIATFESLIDQLPSLETIQADPNTWKETVEEANKAYKNLSTEQQAYLVSADVNKLLQAVEAVGGEQGGEDLTAVRNFNDKVDAIGSSVTLESESTIKEAKTAYEGLTEEQKTLVTERYNTLLNAEAALSVVKQIAEIGTVTLESETAITAARQAYTDYVGKFSNKNMVSNLNVLEAAEAALEILQGGGADTSGYQGTMKKSLAYLAEKVKNPIVGSTNGEWAVLAQARASTLTEDARAAYLANLADYVETHDGILDTSKNGTMHTEYARVVVALTALGVDATRFQASDGGTYNLVKPLLDKAAEDSNYAYQVSEQGNNGTIWALIALDSGNYYRDEAGNKARAAWIDLLINMQQDDGNWPIYNPDQVATGSGSDLGGVDVCAMALQALAPYYLDAGEFNRLDAAHSYEDLQNAVKKALDFLSTSQNSTGGYGSSESSAQVIVALAALNKDAGGDEEFVKNNISVLADLLSYGLEDGSFGHDAGKTSNQMSTEQAAYALVAYDRYKNNKKPLYDMSDVFDGPAGGTDTDHTIHASADAGGTISPVGDITVPDGANQSFTVTPNEGYQIEDILVDGKSVWAGGVTVAQKLEPPEYQLPTVPVEDVEPEACADGIHVGENVVIGQRAATCTESGYTGDMICGACGEVLEQGAETRTVPHQYGGAWQTDETSHWQVCQICGAKSSAEPHVFEQTEEPAPPEPELPEQGEGTTQKPTTSEEAEEPGPEPEMPDADEQQPEETEGQDPDTIPPERERDPETPVPGEENGEGSADGNESPAEEETEILESAEVPAGDKRLPDEYTSHTDAELVSVVGVHPMLLMGMGAGLPQMDGTAEAYAEESVCQVCGYTPETGSTALCSHSGGTATCMSLAVCDLCGQPYGDYAQHAFTETAHSSGMHWNVCAACGMEDLSSMAPHSWELDEAASTETISVYVCPDCGAERTEAVSAAPIAETNALVTSADSKSYIYTFENVTEDHAISVTFEKLSPVIVQEVTINGNTQTAVIDEAAVRKAVEVVTASAADTITIIPTEDSSKISLVSVELPAGAAQIISEASAGVEIQTSNGTVTLPANVLSSIAQKETDGKKLSIHVEKKNPSTMEDMVPDGTDLAGSVAVEVSVRVDSTEITSFDGHDLTVTIPVDNSFILGREYKVLVTSDDGSREILTGTCRVSDSGRVVSVSVDHLSTFIVLAETTAQTFTITATAGGNGDIDPFGTVEVDAGEDQIFHITPDNGYEIATLRVDGKTVDLDELYIRSDGSASYTFYDVDASHSIRATFQRGTEIPDFGPVVGEVYISIENNTYRGGDFTGTLASGWYDLCAEDTMMTSVLKALALDGYSWWGTGASDTGGYDITYLSGIYVDENGNGRRDNSEPSLAEFDGSRGAGWMGTLNDWFVNEGFQSFRVGGRGAYELADGDYLNIVFTQNLGEDVGSLWGNSDTSLEDLHISGGILAPRFDGDTLEYTLSITGNSARVTVTPTAVNKNYMVKTFLNRYNRDSAFYKRTESITVKPGDILYIGVGDPSWPSMNNQSTEAIDYEGTKYTITVVNGNSVEAVIEMIKALPEITYANYKTQASKVSAARAAYNALTKKAKAEISQTLLDKLEAAEEKVEFYEEIDAAKKLLKELPAVNKSKAPTSSLIRQVRKAADAYEKLNSKQRESITVEDAERYEALRLWLIESGAVGQNELPVIDGSLTLPEQDGVEVVLEPKASVDNSGNASATVTAAALNKLLDEALEAEASVLVIAPTGVEQASAISVELPRRTLDNALDETNADLAVRTPLGELSMPNLTLAKILSRAGGQDLTVNMARRTISQAEALLNGRVDVTEEQMSGASTVEVSITSGNKSITSFGGRSITLLLPVNAVAFQAGQACTVYQISGGGTVEKLAGICLSRNGGLWVKVSTTQLGTFVAVPPEQPVQLPFADVREGDWFYDAVAYAYTNGIFSGTSTATFSPNNTMTRSMLVTVLWRMEGEPAVNSANPFADVAAGTWYTDAVIWANSTGIVNGTGTAVFAPNDSVTREQLTAILYRYAKTKGRDISGTSALSAFLDGNQVSDWAARAVEWACAEGLLTGKDDGRLDPQGQASRAEVATILMRLLESKAKNA